MQRWLFALTALLGVAIGWRARERDRAWQAKVDGWNAARVTSTRRPAEHMTAVSRQGADSADSAGSAGMTADRHAALERARGASVHVEHSVDIAAEAPDWLVVEARTAVGPAAQMSGVAVASPPVDLGPEPSIFIDLPSAEALGFWRPESYALSGDDLVLAGTRLRPARPPRGADAGTGTRLLSLDFTWIFTIVAISGVALAMRLINHSSSYALFIDEITYSTIGQAVALGHGVTLYGPPFFLHPPLFFYLEGGLLDLFGGAHASPVHLVLELRPINCVIGAIECALVMTLVRRFTNRTAAILVGVFFAVDPFLLLWDGRVLLETLAMTFAVMGWLCVEWISRREVARPARETQIADQPLSLREWRIVVLGGLLFGASLLSKETYGFAGMVPMLLMFILGSPIRRKIAGTMFAIAAGCYVVYLATVIAAGDLHDWYEANVAGVLRAVGTKQVTGFNQAGHHASFGSRIGADLAMYGISYIVILATFLATATGVIRWFLNARAGRTLSTQQRIPIMMGVGAVGYVGYAVVFGAFEVQIFYMGVIGGLPVLVSEVLVAWPRVRSRIRLSRRTLTVIGVTLAALVLAFEAAADVRLRSERDTALEQLNTYVNTHVHYPALVDSTDGVTQFILRGVRVDGPLTVRGLKRDHPDFVVVDAGLVNEGYVHLGPGFQTWLKQHATVVFRATGLSTGKVLLYQTSYARKDRVAVR